jgi:hypothetical protein
VGENLKEEEHLEDLKVNGTINTKKPHGKAETRFIWTEANVLTNVGA